MLGSTNVNSHTGHGFSGFTTFNNCGDHSLRFSKMPVTRIMALGFERCPNNIIFRVTGVLTQHMGDGLNAVLKMGSL